MDTHVKPQKIPQKLKYFKNLSPEPS